VKPARVLQIVRLHDQIGASTDQRMAAAYSAIDDLLDYVEQLTSLLNGRRLAADIQTDCPLSAEQLTALIHAANGHSTASHAAMTDDNPHTIRSRRNTAFQTLRAATAGQAIARCMVRGWITPADILADTEVPMPERPFPIGGRHTRPMSDTDRVLGQIARGEVLAGPSAARQIAARHEAEYGDAFTRPATDPVLPATSGATA
jgi:hypothetical protein